MSELDQLLLDIKHAESISHACQDWQPDYVGGIDIRITRDGQWFHEGRPFKRMALVKLFASILRREGDEYYLVTPAEKLSIVVDDAPFLATAMTVLDADSKQAISFTTTLGDTIIADNKHPIRVEVDQTNQQPKPYVYFRDGMEALISRSAFFDLANMAQEVDDNGLVYLVVQSMGAIFTLGSASE